ncbi:ABC transporter permease [Marinitenerispora sediminis]|uniref:Peptide ABC transporter permease n=1 Tax=Marinitenerispora sediminis TaxID=1931232 RepID=A0A368T9C8_9ACTN|nr:ABC transporter permease [Marinitenerispora sediminis]RCV52432.1 peptide ABC transporter permease [Marinitenerispora sediminis]RCV60630.1 peptide ABC transporter permease [Marinitenerispora sediminis]RCV61103.1 peptide ABC transporter permease [Marinitenerispora sediminis]
MTAPLDASESADRAEPEAITHGVRNTANRSLRQIAWQRFRRDKVALGGGIVVALLVLIALLAPLLTRWFGYPPNEFHQSLIDPLTGGVLRDPSDPMGGLDPMGGISADHLLGLEPVNGRDLFSRIVYGAQISLLVAFGATVLCVVIGTFLGVIAGYFGGWVDAVISRAMDIFLAFPLLLFAIALAGVIPDGAFGLQGNGLRVGVIIFIIGFFNWPYIGRIVRGQTLTLKEREFVEAARSLGASNSYILFRELLPNLVTPILVYSTLLIPTNIIFEASLSFLGVGINPPTPSWGGMLSNSLQYYTTSPHFVIIPGLAIFITVLAFNLLGDGLRDAFDPRSTD